MSYVALYRKYRPDSFLDVKGQDVIVQTLRNQITRDRVGHAYLFCGTRGTGKTSVAKLFAKAINCENPNGADPCGICASCVEIAAGASMNVIEIDAASNNGVDHIREIREEVAYRPTVGKYKVYIIDEVHMLSAGAFNALLKTLEEPPEYVVFILATTEAHKLPVTIVSRCQRFDFRRISVDIIFDRLKELTEKEGLRAQEKALKFIAISADGSMRDALSILDRCASFYTGAGQELTHEQVVKMIGTVDTDVFSRLFKALISGDALGLLDTTNSLLEEGRELSQVTLDFVSFLRDLLLIKMVESPDALLHVSSSVATSLKELSNEIDATALLLYIKSFSELSGTLRNATAKRVVFETALLKLVTPAIPVTDESVTEKIRVLEREIEKLKENGITVISNTVQASVSGTETKAIEPPSLPEALPEEVEAVAENFSEIIDSLGHPIKGMLKEAKLSVGSKGQLLIVFPDRTKADTVGSAENKPKLKAALTENVGKNVEFEIVYLQKEERFEQNYADLLEHVQRKITMQIDVISDIEGQKEDANG
ncbi:MAG: DNA polymerase III subunit gamma/tau [Lachnospiraceae bacterium]|jgi:DNA polymerase-3 subunit gamma/tau|nr:DNA polymerase III subunit gamma/tau [Lachnospiraceae bacterium]